MNKYLVSIYSGKGRRTLGHLLSQGNHHRQWLQEALVIVLTDMRMVKEERMNFAGMLLCSGASPDVFTPDHQPLLCWAVERADADIVNLLLSFAANVNAKDAEGWPALHYCAHRGLSQLTSVLLAAGADPNAQETHGGDTALSVALGTQTPKWDLVALLLLGTNVNQSNHLAESPLIKLALHNQSPLAIQSAEGLIRQGAHLNAQNAVGETALILAATAEGGNLHVVNVLIEAGCDVNIKDHSGHTALHLVAMHPGRTHFEQDHGRYIARALIHAGADVDTATDNDLHRLPPLGFALMSKNWLVMLELLQCNCAPIAAATIVRPFRNSLSMDQIIIECLEYLMVDAGAGGYLTRWMEFHKVMWTLPGCEFEITEVFAPLSLTRLCRRQIRRVLPPGGDFHRALERLLLPEKMKRFISLQSSL